MTTADTAENTQAPSARLVENRHHLTARTGNRVLQPVFKLTRWLID